MRNVIVTLSLLILSTSIFAVPVEDFVTESNTWATYLRSVQQTINELTMIQNQVQQLQYDAKNTQGLSLQEWDNASNALLQLSNAINQANALTYMNSSHFSTTYPGYSVPATNNYSANYQGWVQTNQATMNGTLNQLNQSYQQQAQEASLDQLLANQAQNPKGRMQAIQVGNEIAAEEVAQLQKIKATLLAEGSAQAEYYAYQSQKDAVQQQTVDAVVKNASDQFPSYQNNSQFGLIPSFGGGS